jgi:hypothetical protein
MMLRPGPRSVRQTAKATAAALLAVAGMTVQAAEPATLTLACEGTTKLGEKLEPISMGIIVDFAARTVHGFGYPGLSGRFDFPVKITGMNEVTIAFHGSNETGESVTGSIDRVTGDVEARTQTTPDMILRYALKCRPTQRMF